MRSFTRGALCENAGCGVRRLRRSPARNPSVGPITAKVAGAGGDATFQNFGKFTRKTGIAPPAIIDGTAENRTLGGPPRALRPPFSVRKSQFHGRRKTVPPQGRPVREPSVPQGKRCEMLIPWCLCAFARALPLLLHLLSRRSYHLRAVYPVARGP